MQVLTYQLGIENLSDVQEFRRLLAEKCKFVKDNDSSSFLNNLQCRM